MMPAQLKETTMNKETRKLINITFPSQKPKLKKANKLVNDLMGKNAEKRLNFIFENSGKKFSFRHLIFKLCQIKIF